MARKEVVADYIIDAVSRSPGCLIEELTRDCPGLTWNQLFLEIAHLSEEGRLILQGIGPGMYTLKLPTRAETLAKV